MYLIKGTYMIIKKIFNIFRDNNYNNNYNNEIIIILAKMKKSLNPTNDNIKEHSFIIDRVEEDLKALKIITNELHKNGFKFDLGKAEYDFDPATCGERFDVNITISLRNSSEFKTKLNSFLDNYLEQLGASLDVVNQEINTKYVTSYDNIINNKNISVSEQEKISSHTKKFKI